MNLWHPHYSGGFWIDTAAHKIIKGSVPRGVIWSLRRFIENMWNNSDISATLYSAREIFRIEITHSHSLTHSLSQALQPMQGLGRLKKSPPIISTLGLALPISDSQPLCIPHHSIHPSEVWPSHSPSGLSKVIFLEITHYTLFLFTSTFDVKLPVGWAKSDATSVLVPRVFWKSVWTKYSRTKVVTWT
jgi:hypothetical protein